MIGSRLLFSPRKWITRNAIPQLSCCAYRGHSTVAATVPSAHAQMETDFRHFWLPFTNNRAFQAKPKLIERAEGVFYYLEDGTQLLDGRICGFEIRAET